MKNESDRVIGPPQLRIVKVQVIGRTVGLRRANLELLRIGGILETLIMRMVNGEVVTHVSKGRPSLDPFFYLLDPSHVYELDMTASE